MSSVIESYYPDIVEKIISYYPDVVDYYRARYNSLGLKMSEFEIVLTPDCPYYHNGIRSIKVVNKVDLEGKEFKYDECNSNYFFNVDLSFFTSTLFNLDLLLTTYFEFSFIHVISNENNLKNLVIDYLQDYSTDTSMLHYYFLIDMSTNKLVSKTNHVYLEYQEFLNWLEAGINIELDYYEIRFTNYDFGYSFDIRTLYQSFLDNFTKLFLFDVNASMHLISPDDSFRRIHIDINIDNNVKEFLDFIDSLKYLLINFRDIYGIHYELFLDIISLNRLDSLDFLIRDNLENELYDAIGLAYDSLACDDDCIEFGDIHSCHRTIEEYRRVWYREV